MSKFLRILEQLEIDNNPVTYAGKIKTLITNLKTKKKVLFLTTSNRWDDLKEEPKSLQLANFIKDKFLENVEVIDVSKLNIYCCEGNVSTEKGNHCGLKESVLKDKDKNPTGYHRCWASINNKDDELWKVSKALFESDAIIFFVSVRWGQANSIYQKLIERLNWIENRHTTLKEENIIANKEAGIIAIGQNWNGETVIETQKKVLAFYGFKVPNELSFNWQYTKDSNDESKESYKDASNAFKNTFDIKK